MSRMVGKDTIIGMGFIGLEHGRLYNMKRGPNVITATITGRRIVLEKCAGGKLRGLILYGKSTQVTTTGAQLLTSAVIKGENCGVTLTKKDSVWHLEGTNTADGVRNIRLMEPTEHFKLPAGTYTFSFSKDGVFPIETNISISKVANPDISSEQIWTGIGNAGLNRPTKFTLDGTEEALSIFVNFPAGEYISCDLYVMLNAGNTALPWEPYTGGKPSPSPDYPQEIVSAGDDGSIGVEVHGKNIFGGRYYYAMYTNGILLIDKSQKDKEVKFPYQPEAETRGICKVLKCQKGKTYVISVTNPNKNATIGMAEYENIENAYAHTKNVGSAKMTTKTKQLYTAKSDGILVCGITGTWTDGKTTVHECTESELLQVEEASEATSYEPYHNPQTLTLSAPNGLPGIMVTSGGNYTDENGQQWICDEVDLERGVYVQRVYSVIVDGVDVVFSQKGPYCNINLRNMPSVKIVYASDQRAATKSTFTSEPWGFNQESGFLYLVKENYAEILNESCRRHNGEVIYALATPIETPLSEADIAAYRALTTYSPTTIVETDGAGMKLDYQRDVNFVIKQLTDTIASMTN